MVLHFTKAQSESSSSLPSFADGVSDIRAELTRVSERVEVGSTQRREHHCGFPALYQHLHTAVTDDSSDDFSLLMGRGAGQEKAWEESDGK